MEMRENKNYWLLGRAKECDLVIIGEGVSRQHLKINRVSQSCFKLEDLSSYGTFLRGQQIKTAIADHSEVVYLYKTPFNLSSLIQDQKPNSSIPGNNSDAAQGLKQIWDDFEHFKSSITNRNLYQRLAIVTGSSLLGMALLAPILPTMIAIGGSMIGGSVGQLISQNLTQTEQLQVLEAEFRANYQCPHAKCRRFLGFTPFEILKKINQCPNCQKSIF